MLNVRLWLSGVCFHLLLQTPERWLVSPSAVPTNFQAYCFQGSTDCVCLPTLAPEALFLLLGGPSPIYPSHLRVAGKASISKNPGRLFIHGRPDNGVCSWRRWNTCDFMVKSSNFDKSGELSFSVTNSFIYLFIYLWLHWVFIAAHGLSLVAASGGYSSLRCAGFSLQWLLLLRSSGSRCVGFSCCGTWAQ